MKENPITFKEIVSEAKKIVSVVQGWFLGAQY
jgi:hypothetical protein